MTALTRLNTDEILRYMGCPPERADAGLRAQAEDCAGEPLGLDFGNDGTKALGHHHNA